MEEHIEDEYSRYLELKADPEYIDTCTRIVEIKHEMECTRAECEKIPPRTSDKEIIHPDDSEYSDAIIRMKLEERLDNLRKEKEGLERVLIRRYGLVIPINPFEDDLTRGDFKKFRFFQDSSIVKSVPYRDPKLVPTEDVKSIPRLQNAQTSRLDLSGYLAPDRETGDPRYLHLEIDTWNKVEAVVSALKDKWESLRKLGVITFKSRRRKRRVDVEKILEMRSQGLNNLQIMRRVFQTNSHPAYDPDADRYYKRIKRVTARRKKA
jgi:hypothetical protein